MPKTNAAIDVLCELGLNQLEAEVYAFLLAHEPMTAYAAGRTIGKATANVYKAVESLSRMGAVLIEEGDSRVCRAVPAREFLRHRERSYASRSRAAAEVLGSLQAASWDERVYRIEHVAEILERCSEMLSRAKQVAVVDAFPRSLGAIRNDLVKAVARGVDVWIEAYEKIEIEGANLVIAATGKSSVEYWGAEQLNVVVDGREALVALMDPQLERVHTALWSRNLYLACLLHSGRTSEQTIHRMHEALSVAKGNPSKVLRGHQFFMEGKVPGQIELHNRYVPRRGKPAE